MAFKGLLQRGYRYGYRYVDVDMDIDSDLASSMNSGVHYTRGLRRHQRGLGLIGASQVDRLVYRCFYTSWVFVKHRALLLGVHVRTPDYLETPTGMRSLIPY